MKSLTKIQQYLLWASFFGTFGEQMLTPLYGIFVKSINGGILEAGFGFAIFSLVTGLAILYTGNKKWFADNTHLVIMLGFLLSGVGDFLYFFVTGPVSLFLVQALCGLSVGLLNPAWDSLYESEGEEGSEHFRWSLWSGGISVSVGAASLVGAFITYWLGFKAMFVLSGLINGIAVIYSYFVYEQYSIKNSPITDEDRVLLQKHSSNSLKHVFYEYIHGHEYISGIDPIHEQSIQQSNMKATKSGVTYDAIVIGKDTTKDQVVSFVESFGDKYKDHFVGHAVGISLGEGGGKSVNQNDVLLRDEEGVWSMVSVEDFNDFKCDKPAEVKPEAEKEETKGSEELPDGPDFDQEEYEESLVGYMEVSVKALQGAYAKIAKKSPEERKAILKAMADRKVAMTSK